MIEWQCFFPSGTRVLALPDWSAPRLLFPADNALDRWKKSGLYPAFRTTARLYRSALRLMKATPFSSTRVTSSNWLFGMLLSETLPETHSVSVLIGTPGPAQKITLQCWDAQKRIIGYLKYAEQPVARKRLSHEYAILQALEDNLGPKPLHFSALGDGNALLVSPITGRPIPAKYPPPPDLSTFTRRLHTEHPVVPITDHPWIHQHNLPVSLQPSIANLDNRQWPVVVQHGDCAPWNLRRMSDGSLCAFDWEYGSLSSLPLLDEVQYLLQISALIHRWTPSKGKKVAMAYIGRHAMSSFNRKESDTIVRLAAFDAYEKLRNDGHADDTYLQSWKRAIWKG